MSSQGVKDLCRIKRRTIDGRSENTSTIILSNCISNSISTSNGLAVIHETFIQARCSVGNTLTQENDAPIIQSTERVPRCMLLIRPLRTPAERKQRTPKIPQALETTAVTHASVKSVVVQLTPSLTRNAQRIKRKLTFSISVLIVESHILRPQEYEARQGSKSSYAAIVNNRIKKLLN